jgi:hypothetical protein
MTSIGAAGATSAALDESMVRAAERRRDSAKHDEQRATQRRESAEHELDRASDAAERHSRSHVDRYG